MAVAEDPDGTQAGQLAAETAAETNGVSTPDREPTGQAPARERVGVIEHAGELPPAAALSEPERRLLGDLFAIVSEHAADAAVEIDRARVRDAFAFACEQHAAQRRKSGEEFIVHPVGVARICASMRLDTETLCAALLHDTM